MLPTKKTQNNWLPSILNDFLGNQWEAKPNVTAPAMNIIENDKEYKIEIASPGMEKDDFCIKVNDENHLVITMKKQHEEREENKDDKYLRHEFSYSQFQQTLILPENVDCDKIIAQQENGILCVTIPKKEVVKNENEKVIPIT
ncbi:MAG: Hsp20/alpha crystallin family protein [Rikenellaceae bacterium]